MKFIVKKIQDKQNSLKLLFDGDTIFEMGKKLNREQKTVKNAI